MVSLPRRTSPDIEAQTTVLDEKGSFDSNNDITAEPISLADMQLLGEPPKAAPSSFFFWIMVNTLATIAIVLFPPFFSD